MQTPQPIYKQALRQAIALHKNDQFDSAANIYNQLIANFPRQADPYNLLGTLYHQRGKQRVAIDLIQKAIKISPKNATYFNNLGNAYRESGEAKDAEKAFRKALKLKPGLVSAMNNLGGSILAAGNISSAINIFIKTLKTNPDFYPARHNLGNAYYEKGENDKAIACYRRVLKDHPDYTKSARNLAEAKRFKEEDDDFARLKALSTNNGLTGENKANVLFAFAKAQDDLKHHKQAFVTYLQANKAHRETYSFDIQEFSKSLQEIRDTIDHTYFHENMGKSENTESPIFIFGMPRSGTSLVEQILSSHPKVFGAGELYFIEKSYFYLIRNMGARSFSDAFRQEDDSFLSRLGNDYIHQFKEFASKAPCIIDKMPRNFLYIGLIKLMLPKAKFIHCKRSPEDTCLSIFKKYFVGRQPFAYDLEELGQYYNLYLEHMAHWRDLLGTQMHEIQYEDIIANQRGETERLLQYCGLSWEEACLDFHKTKRAVRTASTDQVRQPLYSSSVEAWRIYETELTPLTRILNQTK